MPTSARANRRLIISAAQKRLLSYPKDPLNKVSKPNVVLNVFQNLLSKIRGSIRNITGKRKLVRPVLGLIGIGIVSIIGYNLYFYFKHQAVLSALENPVTLNLQEYEKNEILKEINDLYSLGENKESVVGKIADVEKLGNQHAFFKKGRNGNYLVVMPNFTLIYDKETKTVVDIARENLLDLKEDQK